MAENDGTTPTGGAPVTPAAPPVSTPPPAEGRTFTQADLDRIVGERLEREKGKYADYDELKKAAAEFKKVKDAQLSEQERATARIKELEAEKAAAEAQAKARELEVTERIIKSEARVLATQMGFASPDDAYALADLAGVTLDDKGEAQGVQKALEKLAKDKPYLVGKGGGAGSPPNDPKRKGGSTDDEWVAEARRRYGIKAVPSQQ